MIISQPYTKSNLILAIRFIEIIIYLFKTINRVFCHWKPKMFLTDSACITGILEENREK